MNLLSDIYENLLKFTLITNRKCNDLLYSSMMNKIKQQDKKRGEFYFENHDDYYLQIGCGLNILPNWLNTDMNPEFEEIIYLDANEKFQFEDEAFKFIFSEHLIEHLNFIGVINLLTESYRVLKIGGRIRIATPKLSFIHDLYKNFEEENNKEYVEWALNQYLSYISKSQYNHVSINHIYGHQIIFTFELLKFLLETVGFKNVCRNDVGKSTISELSGIERHSNIIPHHFNIMETMVLEAVK